MIIIRSDSSFETGTGHIMRCLVLADMLAEMGQKVHFVCKDLPGNISEKVKDKHNLTLLPPNLSEEAEAKVIFNLNPDWIVVDHYGLDETWEKAFAGQIRIFAIDDLFNRKHAATVLLDQNYHVKKNIYDGLVPSTCRNYVGSQFALLNKKVLKTPESKEKQKHILCFFGGTDFTGEGLKLATALNKVKPQFPFTLAIGKNNVNFDSLVNLKSDYLKVLVEPPDWESLVAKSLLYFGSGGIITWERFFLGTPGVVVAVAENQVKIAEDLAADNLQYYWGLASYLNYENAIPKLIALTENNEALDEMSDRAKKCVRPFPPEILKLWFAVPKVGFFIKPASIEHLNFLFELRNDEAARKMFRNMEPVPLADHKAWLERKLKDPESRIYIGYKDQEPCGQFRVDADGQTSVTVHSRFRGQGFGEKLISNGTEMYFLENPDVQMLKADIKNENISSVKSFKAAGYIQDTDSEIAPGYIRFSYEQRRA